jgi:hypothetical protein
MTAPMRALADTADLAGVDRTEVLERFRAILAQGWGCEEDGAWVLRGLRASYHGRRATFTDLTSWEAEVNGRPIPDLACPTITPTGPARFCAGATRSPRNRSPCSRRCGPPPRVTGYVQVAETLIDNPVWVAPQRSGPSTPRKHLRSRLKIFPMMPSLCS